MTSKAMTRRARWPGANQNRRRRNNEKSDHHRHQHNDLNCVIDGASDETIPDRGQRKCKGTRSGVSITRCRLK